MMQDFNSYSFSGKRVLIRVDFNVPFDKSTGLISDASRIERSVPTIKHVVSNGGKAILLSHMGRPKGKVNNDLSLQRIAQIVETKVGKSVRFVPEVLGSKVERAIAEMQDGDVLLLENVRFYPEEEGKVAPIEGESDERLRERKSDMKSRQIGFAKKVARHGDCFVNDAFGAAHRAHATTTYLAYEFPYESMFGLLMSAEIDAMNRFVEGKAHPVTAILGGAKVSDKLPLLRQLVEKVDKIIIGGGMAYTFVKARGGNIGNSLCEEGYLKMTQEILAQAKERGVEVLLPTDSVNGAKFEASTTPSISPIDKIPEGMMGMDIGPRSRELFAEAIGASKAVLWNGPMGVFEFPAFAEGTLAVAKALVKVTQEGAYTLVGGGDSVAALRGMNYVDGVSYVSTGGGAMLEYLEGKKLPGIAAIADYKE